MSASTTSTQNPKSDRDINALSKLAADAYSTTFIERKEPRENRGTSGSSKQADEMLAGFSLDIFFTDSTDVAFAVL